MNKIFDTHTHYDDKAYGSPTERDAFLSSLLAENVAGFIAVGCNPKRNRLALEIAGAFDAAYCSAGIHPLDVAGIADNSDYITDLQELIQKNRGKVAAIGETGLDYHYKGYDKDLQTRVFKSQLALSLELNLPAIIHCREAYADALPILQQFASDGGRAVVHCFSENADAAREYVSLGFYISFTGAATFKSAHRTREALAAVPPDRLMLETDCPYMAPEPFRGKRCDSGMLKQIAQKFAEVQNVSTEELITRCNNNAKNFFNIKNLFS